MLRLCAVGSALKESPLRAARRYCGFYSPHAPTAKPRAVLGRLAGLSFIIQPWYPYAACRRRGLAQESYREEERLLFGGMARRSGIDFFGPNYSSSAERRNGKIYVWIDPSNLWKPKGFLARISGWPVVRSILFWIRVLLQLLGSVWVLVSFVGIMLVL